MCVTEREKFVVPVRAVGARALLDFPDEVNFSAAPVKVWPCNHTSLIEWMYCTYMLACYCLYLPAHWHSSLCTVLIYKNSFGQKCGKQGSKIQHGDTAVGQPLCICVHVCVCSCIDFCHIMIDIIGEQNQKQSSLVDAYIDSLKPAFFVIFGLFMSLIPVCLGYYDYKF